MYALLPASVIAPGYTGAPSLAVSPGWGTHQHGGASNQQRRVTLYRDSLDTSWGFRLHGGKDLNIPLSVKRVFSGSPADGQLTRDDLILAINDRSVVDLSSAEVLQVIRSAGSSIVLSIETSPFDSAFGGNFEPIREPVHHQEPIQFTQPKPLEAKPSSDYEAHQSLQSVSYETSTSQDHSRPTAASGSHNPKVTTQSRHRSAHRFQATAAAAPYGLSEPGWAPRPKPGANVASAVGATTTATAREPVAAPVHEPPVSQHRSARQQTRPQGSSDASWRSQYASVEDSNVPAWYGSLRSTRAAHSWEVRAAKTTQSSEQDSTPQNVPTVSQQDTWRGQPEQTQSQEQSQSRTYKAEIRGLMLARPTYQQTQSTPDWTNTSGGQEYHSSGQPRSAPETPNADAYGRTIYSDVQTAPAAHSQPTDSAAPIKIQPSVLFASGGAIKIVQPSAQAQVIHRGQHQEVRVAHQAGHHREETRVSGVQAVSGPRVQQPVVPAQVPTAPKIIDSAPKAAETARNISAPTIIAVEKPILEQAKEPQRVPTLHKAAPLPGIIERFNPVPDRPQRESPKQAQPTRATPVIERFNPTPDREERQVKTLAAEASAKLTTKSPVERFNPTPDRPGKPVERFNPTPDRPVIQVKVLASKPSAKLASKSPVERFNPTPDRPERSVERFNPTPDRPGIQAKVPASKPSAKFATISPVERFNPTPEKQTKLSEPSAPHSTLKSASAQVESVSHHLASSTKPVASPAVVKSPQTPIERFNPTPDRPLAPRKTAAHTSEKSQQTPLERFNPTPDAPLRQGRIERFNPVPDRP